MARSAFVPMEEKEQGAAGRGAGVNKEQVEKQEVLLMHSQVRRIKKEDEARERLLKLRLLETRPAASGGVAWRAPRFLSPLRRAGSAIPVPVGE
ncbi:unnamed protein product [Miscanthus lutarioriparius]|uniref:Uncharacterized protein n=1 Tax=Miscanthus lutarioriparius TaxID=422564 RepID=A0A811ND23_9POAL|nr:unnamed protein product [Miscanthus lutarioriparius]